MARAVTEWIGKSDDTRAPPRVLLRIFLREGGICKISGRKIAPGERWQADHGVALINGGENRESNLFPVLIEPHKEKTRRDVAEKGRVAARAKSHIGATSKGPAIPSRGFAAAPRAPKRLSEDKRCAGPSAFARRFGLKEDA